MKILITGGSGYIGDTLVRELLKKKNKIINIDTNYYGCFLKNLKNVKNLNLDYDKIDQKLLYKVDTVIHLAAISNDPSALINSKISWETNVLKTYNLLEKCKKAKIKKFIFASSGSVYGINKSKKVTENTKLLPITDYNKTKMIGEKIVNSYSKFFNIIILRPGTVCGFSKNIRLDLTVNAMTYDALKKNQITIYGGKQIRPQLNIKDMVRCYLFFLKKKNCTGIFNVGFENYSINKIAKLIKKQIPTAKIIKRINSDIRSYKLCSEKLKKIGFYPNYDTEIAIKDFIKKYRDGEIKKKLNNIRTKKLKKILNEK